VPISDPVVQAARFYMGPNVWPKTTSLSSDDFREPIERYYQAINQLALKILDLIAKTLPYNTEIFSRFSSGHVIAPLRLLHYPPALAHNHLKNGQMQFGAGAHTDFGAITLLIQDENSGLEVWDPRANEWVSVEPTPGAFVVNVGDMLSAWTGGIYKSSIHRVINKKPKDRYSAAFFFDGSCKLSSHSYSILLTSSVIDSAHG
jgi:isopenicillin N synthase-like dioxygenase